MPEGNTIEAEAAISAVLAELNEMHAAHTFVDAVSELKDKLFRGEISVQEVIAEVENIRNQAIDARSSVEDSDRQAA